MSRSSLFSRSVLWLPLACLAGCVGGAPSATLVLANVVGEGTSQQGTELLGMAGYEDVTGFAYSSLSLNGILIGLGGKIVQPGQLVVATKEGTALTGANVRGVKIGGGTVDMRIAQIDASDALPGMFYYHVQTFAGGHWTDVCTPTQNHPLGLPPEITAGDVRAVVLPGSWTPNGRYAADDTSRFTFACVSAVVAKCDLWGHSPFGSTNGVTASGAMVTLKNSALLDTCAAMARDDLCGDGTPHTVDGTLIQHSDIVSPLPPELPGFYFEAAWLPPSLTHRRSGALCLSKLRWATLPIGDECSGQLKDPRVHGKEYFCESYQGNTDLEDPVSPSVAALTAMEAGGAVMFSRSQFNDSGLWAWLDPTTTRRLTTTKLIDQGVGQVAAWRPGFVPPTSSIFPRPSAIATFEGAVFNAPRENTVALRTYRTTKGDYLTTTKPQSGLSVFADEGYIYAPDGSHPPEAPPLRRYYNSAADRFWTTTGPVPEGVDGWSLVRLEGYLPR